MEPGQDVQGLAGGLGYYIEVGLPHVSADIAKQADRSLPNSSKKFCNVFLVRLCPTQSRRRQPESILSLRFRQAISSMPIAVTLSRSRCSSPHETAIEGENLKNYYLGWVKIGRRWWVKIQSRLTTTGHNRPYFQRPAMFICYTLPYMAPGLKRSNTNTSFFNNVVSRWST